MLYIGYNLLDEEYTLSYIQKQTFLLFPLKSDEDTEVLTDDVVDNINFV